MAEAAAERVKGAAAAARATAAAATVAVAATVAAAAAADYGCAACADDGCAACADDGCAQEEAERGRGLRLDGGAACRSRNSRGRRRWRRRWRRRRRRSNRCSRCRDRIHCVRLRVRRRRMRTSYFCCHFRCTHWYRRPEGGQHMCRMRSGSWPTPRDSHSTRWGLCCKSCTEHIHQQCHQSRTSRCSPDPSSKVRLSHRRR